MNNKIKISIIGTQGIPAQYGGFETLVENIVKNKAEFIEYIVFCSALSYKKRQENYLKAKLKYIYLKANGISSIFYESFEYDIMLILGVSGAIFLPFIRLLYKGKIITNIDGIEWKREKWSKLAKFILRISEKTAVKYSDVIIGDNQGIIDYIKKTYKKDAAFIEYGADNVNAIEIDQQEYSFIKRPYAITICRIEPENNIHIILDAFSRQIELSLVFIGNWKNSKYGLNLIKKYSNNKNIYMLDPIFDQNKLFFLRSNSFLYIHGHSVGGTNPSLIEAMFYTLPILAFNCIYNKYTTENKCLYWSNADELFQIITNYDKKMLKIIGKDMKSITDKRYKWNIIVSKYEKLYVYTKSKKI